MARSGDEARLAVLIDADNASAKHLERLLAEIAKYGTAGVRRAYGDWTSSQLGSWKTALLEHSVQPIQQFAYTQGKNATDSALIIDAMDLLHAGNLDGFCLVSSDSDFTRLAARIREEGLKVYGFGERKTPKPFVAACDTFIYVENLAPATEPATTSTSTSEKPTLKRDATLDRLLAEAVDAAAGDDGWANLGTVGQNLSRLASDFDSRTYGYGKLKDLMQAHRSYQVQSRPSGDGKSSNAFVKRRQTGKRAAARQ
ncbi:NYN domain-containing protein [Demequina mangrovi]|uniref:OST-HTH/LOTUS domain-containing protein n=1 Tax=Demequina mangrovi TaxID=1043493 RepID=A0A1H7B1I7_9MICO|nr:NYN domain-containing protein [Demequina mangrovi]SEJ71016.1 OST-HTH/LOTUS domain-containing protein [Demequina mangrovi]